MGASLPTSYKFQTTLLTLTLHSFFLWGLLYSTLQLCNKVFATLWNPAKFVVILLAWYSLHSPLYLRLWEKSKKVKKFVYVLRLLLGISRNPCELFPPGKLAVRTHSQVYCDGKRLCYLSYYTWHWEGQDKLKLKTEKLLNQNYYKLLHTPTHT